MEHAPRAVVGLPPGRRSQPERRGLTPRSLATEVHAEARRVQYVKQRRRDGRVERQHEEGPVLGDLSSLQPPLPGPLDAHTRSQMLHARRRHERERNGGDARRYDPLLGEDKGPVRKPPELLRRKNQGQRSSVLRLVGTQKLHDLSRVAAVDGSL